VKYYKIAKIYKSDKSHTDSA